MGFFRVRLNGKFRGNDCVNIFHYDVPSSDATTIQSLVDAIGTTYTNELGSILGDDWSAADCTVYDMEQSELFGIDVPFTGGPIAGSSSGQLVPPGAAIHVSWRFVGTKPNRGGTFLSGFNANAIGTGGGVATTAVSAVDGWALEMLTHLVSPSTVATLHIYSQKNSVPPAVVSNQVDAYIVATEWSGQSRRRIGRGS